MIPDLTGLTPDVLRDLTNVGTVRRATREVAEGRVELTFVETDAGLQVAASDDTVCVLGAGAFDTWRCDCAAGGSCRHIVRAVLGWQAQGPASESPVNRGSPHIEPDPSGSMCGDSAQSAGVGGAAASTPAAEVVDARVRRAAEGARERLGLVAAVQRGERVTVVLHVPAEATVRFGADADPRFARCDCGVSGCAHLDHAAAALAAEAAASEAPATAADQESAFVVFPGEGTATVPSPVVRDVWAGWWELLVDLGLSASEELLGSAVRLAADLEAGGLVHPGGVVRDLIAQLAHHAAGDAEVSPTRVVALAGELESRLRRLERDASDGVPPALVAGVPESEQPLDHQRLVGLGAEHLHVAGWSRLRVYLGEVRTGAVRTLTIEAVDTDDVRVTAQRLGRRARAGSRLADWAVGGALLPRSKRRGAELVVPRGTTPVHRGTRWELPPTSPLLAPTLAELAVEAEIPAPLAPRGSVAGVGAVQIAEVTDLAADRLANRISATLLDVAGGRARLELPLSERAKAGSEATLARLASGRTSAVAGRWIRRADGLVVHPTLLDGPEGPLVVPLGDPGEDAGDATDVQTRREAVPDDPWRRLLGDLGACLGRLIVLGSRRHGAAVRGELADHADTAQGLGLLRWATLLRTLANEPDPARWATGLLDLAVLLAFAE